MPPVTDITPVLQALQTSNPMAVLVAVSLIGWWWERKQNKELQSKLFELGAAQIQSNTRLEGALRALRERVRDLED